MAGPKNLGIELRVTPRLVAQHIGRREPGAVALGEALELAHDARGAEVVGVSQRAAAERRGTQTQKGAHGARAGGADHPPPRPPPPLVPHYQPQPPGKFPRAPGPPW